MDRISKDDEKRILSGKNFILKYVDSVGPTWRDAYNGFEHARYSSLCRCLVKFICNDPEER